MPGSGAGPSKSEGRQPGAADAFAANVLPPVQHIRARSAPTLRATAKALNARVIRTARGGAWHSSTVGNLLAGGNRSVRGLVAFDSFSHPGPSNNGGGDMRLLLAFSLVGGLIWHSAGAQTPVHTPPPRLTCPGDAIVWVNTRSGVYHFHGER